MSLLKKIETQSVFRKESLLERVLSFRKKFFPIIGILLLSGVLVEVWAANRLSTYGEQIAKMTQESQQLSFENQILKDQIAQRSSFYQVEQHAKLLGFGDIQDVQYIQPLDLALNH